MTFSKLVLAAALATTFAVSANAATQTIDAGGYTFSYDDNFWAGAVSKAGDVFTFAQVADQGYSISARGTSLGSSASFSDEGIGAVVVTAKAGNGISGIVTSYKGTFEYTLATSPLASTVFSTYVSTNWITNKGYVGATSAGLTGGLSNNVYQAPSAFSSNDDFGTGFAAGTTLATGNFFATGNLSAEQRGTNAKLRLDTVSFAVTVSAVPEPESYAMLLAGLGLIGTIARRRKAKQG